MLPPGTSRMIDGHPILLAIVHTQQFSVLSWLSKYFMKVQAFFSAIMLSYHCFQVNPNCVEMKWPTVHPAMGKLGPINELCIFLPYKKWRITGKSPTYSKIMAVSHCKIFFLFKAWQPSFLTIPSKTTAFFPYFFPLNLILKVFFFKIY